MHRNMETSFKSNCILLGIGEKGMLFYPKQKTKEKETKEEKDEIEPQRNV